MPIKQRTIDYVQDTRLLVARAREFERRGAAAEALVAYDMAASLIDGFLPGALHADLYRWKGTLLRDIGETTKAACLLKRSLEVAHYVLYAGGVARAQHVLGSIHLRKGDIAAARQLYGDASLNAAGASDQHLYALLEQSLGEIAEIQGDLEGARVRYHMSLRSLRATGDDEGMGWALHHIALLHIATGRYAEATQTLEQADEIVTARGDRAMEVRLALGRTALLQATGDIEGAAQEHARVMTMTERRHERPLRAEALLNGARLLRARREFADAATVLEEASELASACDDVLALARIRTELGEVLLELNEQQHAAELWGEALEAFTVLGATRQAVALQQRLAAQSGARNDY